jgi:serine/threonine protein kinase
MTKFFSIRMNKATKKIKKYTFHRPINESRFQVYLVSKLAQKKNAKMYYAAKIFQTSSTGVFNNELQVSKKFNHPNIIKLKLAKKNISLPISNKTNQMDEEFNVLFYENAPYGDLLGYLIENGAFDDKLARSIFLRILNGMEEMHSKAIAHLDIKPDNVVIGKNFEVKLIDFGHCRLIKNVATDRLKDFNVGTPSYMPPELRSKTAYDPFKVDVFNLGILLFCLLAAQAPFEIADQSDLRYNYIYKKDEKGFWNLLDRCCLHKVRKNFVSDNIRHLIFKMLSHEPSERPTLEEVKNSIWMKEPVLENAMYVYEMQRSWSALTKINKCFSSN